MLSVAVVVVVVAFLARKPDGMACLCVAAHAMFLPVCMHVVCSKCIWLCVQADGHMHAVGFGTHVCTLLFTVYVLCKPDLCVSVQVTIGLKVYVCFPMYCSSAPGSVVSCSSADV